MQKYLHKTSKVWRLKIEFFFSYNPNFIIVLFNEFNHKTHITSMYDSIRIYQVFEDPNNSCIFWVIYKNKNLYIANKTNAIATIRDNIDQAFLSVFFLICPSKNKGTTNHSMSARIIYKIIVILLSFYFINSFSSIVIVWKLFSNLLSTTLISRR